jgi:hypothetical protein
MQRSALAGEERIGLGLAIAAHAALLAGIVWHPPMAAPAPTPERIAVTISDDVGLTSTSPEPNAAAAPDVAPVRGEQAAAEPAMMEQPKPVPQLAPPRPLPQAMPSPKPVAAPAPRARPQPVAAPRLQPQPDIIAELARRAPAQRMIPRPAGGSRIGNDFLRGVAGAQANGASQNQPAAAIGPSVQSSLAGAISRQLKPHWAVPQGADADKLVTVLAWSLNRDGTLAGPPRVVRQDGVNDANRAQAALHAEQAIRAVQLAAPFNLPAEYYDGWKRVAAFRFDRRL